jgi:hypothetical protein
VSYICELVDKASQTYGVFVIVILLLLFIISLFLCSYSYGDKILLFFVFPSHVYNVVLCTRVFYETSFDSKQPKLEPKLVSILSETRRLFRLFRFNIKTACFGVSVEPKQ